MAAKAKSQATISFVRKPKIKRPGYDRVHII